MRKDLFDDIAARVEACGVTAAAEAEATVTLALLVALDDAALASLPPDIAPEARRLREWLSQRLHEATARQQERAPLCAPAVTFVLAQRLRFLPEGEQ